MQLGIALADLNLQVTQGFRTWEQQNDLYAQGRTMPGPIVTNAQGGYSAHNFGYAIDLVPEDIQPGQPNWNVSSPAWQRLLATAPSCKLAEGARWRSFPDNPHFYLVELPADPTDEMRSVFLRQGLQALWDSWNITAALSPA